MPPDHPPQWTRGRLQVVIPLVLSLLGLIDAIARIWLLPWPVGLVESLHDPGKTFFHIILLPIVAFLLIRHFPKEFIQVLTIPGWKRIAAIATLVAITVLSLLQVTEDARKGFFERLTTPENLAEPVQRKHFLDERLAIWSQVKAGTINPPDAKIKGREAAGEAVRGIPPTFINVLVHGSFRQWTASTLSFLGTFTAAFVFALILMVPILGQGILTDRGKAFFLILITSLSTWIPMKVYSEYYHNFGHYSADDPAIAPAVVFAIIAIALLFAFKSKDPVFTIPSAVLTIASALFFLISQGMPDAFGKFSLLAAEMSVYQLAFFYGGILITLPSLVLHLSNRLDS